MNRRAPGPWPYFPMWHGVTLDLHQPQQERYSFDEQSSRRHSCARSDTVQMGPWCTRILADYGADMIKVEAPEGNSSRYTGVSRHRGMSGSFQHNARGKRSIAMDLKHPAAREALLRLVPTVQAFVSNIRPQALARLGLGYETVKQHNPSIVYLSMVGYGSGGRYAGRPAYDDLIQAASGIPMLLQRSTGQPRFIPMAAIDRIVGSAAANALLAGLLASARTGVGQHIEVPMFETMAQFVLAEHMQGAPSTHPPVRLATHARCRSIGARTRPWTASSPCSPTTTANGAASSRPLGNRMSWRTTRASPTSPPARQTSMRFTKCSARN